MSELHQRVAAGDLSGIRRCLRENPDAINRHDAEGLTPLMVAVEHDAAGLEVLEALRTSGGDMHAVKAMSPGLDLNVLDAEVVEALRNAGDESQWAMLSAPQETVATESLLQHAVCVAPLEKVRWLLAAGASPTYVDGHGYGVFLKAIYRQVQEDPREYRALLRCLLDAGAPPDLISDCGESPLHVASGRGDFSLVFTLLDWGLNPEPLGWDPLCLAVASGSYAAVEAALPESSVAFRDSWERTPFLLSVHAGHSRIAMQLLERGSDVQARGRGDTSALGYAIETHQQDLLKWLLPQFDLGVPCAQDQSPLRFAVACDALACVGELLDAGADIGETNEIDGPIMSEARSVAGVRRLHAAGANLGHMPTELRGSLVNATEASVPSLADYKRHRRRTFGLSNPQQQTNPFGSWMIGSRISADEAVTHFAETGCDRDPVWCFQRFGQSLTELPDRRFVEIGGEHEDFYDPDFCIYNDVVLHDGHGGHLLFGYPRTEFPPTDFHSATLIGEAIYVIGNLGYPADRIPGHTPVFRLCCQDWSMTEVLTHGEGPGWLHDHEAVLVAPTVVRVSGGKRYTGSEIVDNQQSFELDVVRRSWRRLGAADNL